MKIGNLELRTGTPDEARLLSSASCSVAEMRRLLAGECLAGTVAKALLACCSSEDRPDSAELARAIAAHGIEKVKSRVARLYAARPAQPKEGSSGEAND